MLQYRLPTLHSSAVASNAWTSRHVAVQTAHTAQQCVASNARTSRHVAVQTAHTAHQCSSE